MAQNEFTKENHETGLPAQVILDSGLNVFALELLVQSFTKAAGKKTREVKFAFRGVDVQLKIHEGAV